MLFDEDEEGGYCSNVRQLLWIDVDFMHDNMNQVWPQEIVVYTNSLIHLFCTIALLTSPHLYNISQHQFENNLFWPGSLVTLT